MKKYYCKDCGKEVCGKNRRCKSCANSGKNNPMFGKRGKLSPIYKGDKALERQKYYCIDCHKEIYKGSKRCKSCCKKGKLHSLYGKHHKKESRIKASITKGGTGIPYENNKYPIEFYKIKYKIYIRDNYTCQNCGMTEEEHLIVVGKTLHCHHIDYNKMNCNESNLITLCLWCNLRANKNREYWKEFYIEKTYCMGS